MCIRFNIYQAKRRFVDLPPPQIKHSGGRERRHEAGRSARQCASTALAETRRRVRAQDGPSAQGLRSACASSPCVPRRTQGARPKVPFPRTCEVDGPVREARLGSGGFPVGKVPVSTGEMSTAAGPTAASQLPPEQMIVVIASCE